MSSLICYQPDDVRAAVGVVSADLKGRRLSPEAVASRLQNLFFRDPAGNWWGVGVRTLRWYRYSGDQWEVSAAPSHSLEGLVGEVEQHLDELPEPSPPHQGDAIGPLQALEGIAEGIRSFYEKGRIQSDAAENLLGQHYLIDTDGHVWTLGFHSRGWFRFHDSRWQPSQHPPDCDRLVVHTQSMRWCPDCGRTFGEQSYCHRCGTLLRPGLDLSDAARVALLDFMEHGLEVLPEPVARPWSPPGSLPESPQAGPNDCPCGCPMPEDARYCPGCGQQRLVRPLENCPGCHKKLLPEALFCAYCGKPTSG